MHIDWYTAGICAAVVLVAATLVIRSSATSSVKEEELAKFHVCFWAA
jgi:hypothetical protein